MPKPGTVFQLEGQDHHIWFVISKEIAGLVLAVNATDESHCPDSPCKLKPGDHPRIRKPSAIYYRKAREFEARKIDREIASGKFVKQLEDCSLSILERIIAGAKKADDLTLRFRDYL